jgi:hypothetical protein
VRGQNDAEAQGPVLLSKRALMQAANSGDADLLAYIARVLSPNADDHQNVPMVQALFCDRKLQNWLRGQGQHRDAAVLEALGMPMQPGTSAA